MGAYNIVSSAALQSGQPEDISVVLANLQAIATVLNGGVDNSNINAAAAIAASKLAGYPADGSKVLKGDGTWGSATRIVRGSVTGAGVGTGTGFTVVRNSAGNYTVTFTTAFSAAPFVLAGVDGAANAFMLILSRSTTSFNIQTNNTGLSATDTPFVFAAIEQ